VVAEYAKASPDDILVRLTVANRGPTAAVLHLLPTLWFRNTWTWGSAYDEGRWAKPRIVRLNSGLLADHETLGRFRLAADPAPRDWAFTENETNPRVFGESILASADWAIDLARGAHCKDAFHRLVVNGDRTAVQWDAGTKAAGVYELAIPAGGEAVVRLRLTAESEAPADTFTDFDRLFADRVREADEFYAAKIPAGIPPETAAVSRQAYAGLLWSEQFYQLRHPGLVERGQKSSQSACCTRESQKPRLAASLCQRRTERAGQVGVPGIFRLGHCVPRSSFGPRRPGIRQAAARSSLAEWYLHPNGQLPAFEYDLSNVDPPVHAWACWQYTRPTESPTCRFWSGASISC